MEAYAEIRVDELGIKSRSKKEIYDLLVTEGDVYLPPTKDAHYKYLSQILVGEKKYLKCSEVKVCRVPQLEGLYVEELLEEAGKHIRIQDYLPEYEYKKLPNRQFLCNIMNTIIGDKFKEYVSKALQQRTKKIVMKKKMTVKALPEFIKIFNESQSISVQKGRSHFLLKRAGRRRWDRITDTPKEQLQEEKKKTKKLITDIQQLEAELDHHRANEKELLENRRILSELYHKEVIDKDGNIA